MWLIFQFAVVFFSHCVPMKTSSLDGNTNFQLGYFRKMFLFSLQSGVYIWCTRKPTTTTLGTESSDNQNHQRNFHAKKFFFQKVLSVCLASSWLFFFWGWPIFAPFTPRQQAVKRETASPVLQRKQLFLSLFFQPALSVILNPSEFLISCILQIQKPLSSSTRNEYARVMASFYLNDSITQMVVKV